MATADLVLATLEALGDGEPAGVSELARRLGTAKSSTQRALVTLATNGWVHDTGREPRQWMLTPKVLAVAAGVGARSGVREAALSELEGLRDETEENVHLLLPDGPEMVLVERLDSPQTVRLHHPIGGRVAMYASSTGKAYLAFLPEAERARILAGGITPLTPNTVSSVEALEAQLAEVRQRGFSLNDAEWREDVSSVAAPIFDATGRPVAAASVSGPSSRLDHETRVGFGPLVRAATRRISVRLGWQPPPGQAAAD